MRQSDEGKWKDRWFVRKLSKEGKILYWFLMDNCDCGGFLEYDDIGWANGSNMGQDEIRKALQELNEANKVLVRGSLETYEALVWVKNYVKIQLGDRALDCTNRFHKGIYRRLHGNVVKFPEIQSLYIEPSMGLPRDFLEATKDQPWVLGKGKGKGKGKREEEEGVGEGEGIEGWENENYRKLIESDLHKTCKYVTFLQMVRAAPDVDWDQAVDHVVNTNANQEGGVRSAYTMLSALMKKPAFRDPNAQNDPNGGMKSRDTRVKGKIAEIEEKWRNGEMTDEECAAGVEKARTS